LRRHGKEEKKLEKLKLKYNGDEIEVEKRQTAGQVVELLPIADPENVVALYINDILYDTHTPIINGGSVAPVRIDSEKGIDILRHSTSHVLAQAVRRLFPDVKLAIGPSIKDGFYYDFDFPEQISDKDFEKIEAEMRKIVEEDQKFERFEKGREKALEFFKQRNETYKMELIRNLDNEENVSFYQNGDFVDLCRGPHLPSTGYIKSFKILNLAGAYWRGDERNPMLTRIYGTSFFSQKALRAYLRQIEEAKKRDHRKLGKQLGLFSFHDEGPGFAFWLPKGVELKNTLLGYWRREHKNAGYVEIQTPILLKKDLWVTSGHWDNYRDNMYVSEIDGYPFAIKPMNCPGGMLVYKETLHSYREFPMRVAEVGLVHRHEKSGVLQGLFRVRSFTQDDAHIFMLPEQIEDEIINVIKLTDKIYSVFGFDYYLELSTRPERSIGTDEQWEQATNGLERALKRFGKKYSISPGEGAFYGPKIDFHLEDCLGRLHQCATIQLDMALPERFDLTFINSDGSEQRPVVIHRTVLGSLERFIGILIEHYAGRFPTWLSPLQVVVMPITKDHLTEAQKTYDVLVESGFRVELDQRNEKLGYKMREAELKKASYIVVIGQKEIEKHTISVRKGGGENIGNLTLASFLQKLQDEVEKKSG
jgi:threonyl-tRNA synthetase